MADRFFGVDVGARTETVVTEGAASTPARHVEIRITTDAAQMSKIEALNKIDLLRARVAAQTWPAA